MQDPSNDHACGEYELPAENLEKLYDIFAGIQRALRQGDAKGAQALCAAGQDQLREVVICYE
jgi:hypothetical protein